MNRTITAAMTTAALIIGAAVSSPAHAAEHRPMPVGGKTNEVKPAPFPRTNEVPTPFPRTNGIKEALHVPVTTLNPQVAV